VSACIIVSAITVGLSSLSSCAVGVDAVIRARREDIPAVVQALNRRARRIKRPKIGLDRPGLTGPAQRAARLESPGRFANDYGS
jgi:hypothetical protein